jgi:hypothetical protein
MNELKKVIIPEEMLDLVRFMCETWSEIDNWAYETAPRNSIVHYPVIQGTENQMKIRSIGEQKYNTSNITKAVEWLTETGT